MAWTRFFRRSRWDDERTRELEAHLAIETDENIARGMTPDAARAAARRKLGNVTRIREEIYDMNSMSFLETARLDLRDAVRQLRRRPLVTTLGFLLLAIGLGASAAAFSVVYGVFLRPLPYPDADRLAVLWEDAGGSFRQVSYQDFRDITQSVRFERGAIFESGRATLSSGSDADRVSVIDGEPALLPLLGARPILGRLLEPDDRPRPVAVISRRLWQRAFQGDAGIVGRAIGLSGRQFTVIGVAAEGQEFELPVGGGSASSTASGPAFTIRDVDVWTTFNPSTSMTSNRAVSAYQALVKLRPDQTIDNAQRGIDIVAANLARDFPATNQGRRFALVPLHEQVVHAKSSAVWTGFGAALLILVVACANLASLLLGELPERRRDFALREALGASRGRLLRQLALESLLLSAASAAVGTFLARLAVESLKRAADLPRLDAIRFDLPVTAAVAGAAAATALAARVVPFGRLLHTRDELRPSVSPYSTSAPMLRRTMVVVQLALAVVLSSSAILLAVSFRRLVLVDPGFVAAHALAARVSAFPARHPAQGDVTRFVNHLAAELEALPEIERAAASSAMPLTGSALSTSVGVAGRLLAMADRASAGWQTITPGYFAALGIPLLAGRDFALADLERAAHLTIVNQTLARRLFGDENPIGRRLALGPADPVDDWHEVVGVVGDVRHVSLAEAGAPRVYDLYGQHWGRTVYLVARGAAEPQALGSAMRSVVRRLDPEAPVFEMQSLDDIVNATVAPRRLATGIAMGTAGVSLLLGAIGLYGLLAGSVAARTRELGIRRALGSSTRAIVRMVCGEAAALAAIGAFVGSGAALVAARAIQSQLFGIEATDPRVIAATAATLAIVGVIATWAPARRAARIDPAIALREE
jgi:putative ABC transport system permease protein